MDKRTSTAALILIAMLAFFIVLQPVLPAKTQPFSELGVLGPSMTFGGYPTNVVVGNQIHLYGYVSNHQGTVQYYQLLVKLGNQTTQISNSTYAQAPVIFTYSHVLDDNQSVTFPISPTLEQQGTGLRLIFELWSYNVLEGQFQYTGVWNQLLVNVTSAQ